MRFLITIIIMFNLSVLFSQELKIETKLSDEYLIRNQIRKLEFEYILNNNKNSKDIDFKIEIDTIYIKEKTAVAICNIFEFNQDSLINKNKERITLTKDSNWKINNELLGNWYKELYSKITKKTRYETLSKLNMQSEIPTDIVTSEEISIRMSESSFIKYPFDSGLYEIGSDYTITEMGTQLFAHGSRMDGSVIYDLSQEYDRAAIVLDTKWQRIIYGRQISPISAKIKEFDPTDENSFILPLSIATKNDGSIFVSDIAKGQISRYVYNNYSHEITIPSNSIFIDNSKVENPVDIELSYDGNYLFVCDIGSKSIKKFTMDGYLVSEFAGDENYTLNKPLYIQPVPDTDSHIYVIDKSPSGEYNLVFIYGSGPYSGYTYVKYKFPSGSKPSDLSSTWEPEIILVPDVGLNMIHVFANTYVCSYNGTNNPTQSIFNNLGRIPSISYISEDLINIETIVFDTWSSQDGFNRFLTGVDLFDLVLRYSLVEQQSVMVDFTVTARAKCTYEVFRNSDNQLMNTNEYMTYAGRQGYPMDFEGYEHGFYKLRITAIPLFNDEYGSYAMQPITKEISFYFGNVWDGDLIFDNPVTISNGETLTIMPGANITFQNGSSLIVDGTLNINGTSSNKVLLDFQYPQNPPKNGIKINPGGTANINYAEIRNAYTGIYINESSALIDNCLIRNGYNGIHLYRTDYSSNETYITNSRIYEQTVGIDLYYSTAQISYNEIDNNYIGISCSNSSPYLATDDNNGNSDGYNNIHTNSFGLYAISYSNPFLGRETCVNFGGNNTIENNTTADVNLNTSCIVYAENNYWGGGPPLYYVGSDCYFDPYPFLYSPPQNEQEIIKITPEEDEFNKKFTPQLSSANTSQEPLQLSTTVSSITVPSGFDKTWPIEWKLLYARNLMRVKKYNDAATICEDVITNYPDSSFSYLALDLLLQSRIKSGNKSLFSQFVEEKAKLKTKKQIYGLAELLLAVGEKENRVSILNGIMDKYKDTPLVEFVLFQKFMYYLYEENNLELAKTTSETLGKLFPNSESYFDSRRQLGEDVGIPLQPQLTKNTPYGETSELPKTYKLLGNYPNPFNPSTTISYALPNSSDVEITIYDITGKVIKTFYENGQSAGYQNKVWNGNNQHGSRVSSGVYFYRFKATSLENDTQVYEKTAKMLLLK